MTRENWTKRVQAAFARNGVEQLQRETEIHHEGQLDEVHAFGEPMHIATGRMTFQHHGTTVLCVDFDRDLVTDFGWSGASGARSRRIGLYMRALSKMRFRPYVQFCTAAAEPFRWTRSDRHNPRSKALAGAGFHEDMFQRFRAGVPWTVLIDGDWWFCGAKYDAHLAYRFDDVRKDIFSDVAGGQGNGWHWFTADWIAPGVWGRRFIDAEAEIRYNKAVKRRKVGMR